MGYSTRHSPAMELCEQRISKSASCPSGMVRRISGNQSMLYTPLPIRQVDIILHLCPRNDHGDIDADGLWRFQSDRQYWRRDRKQVTRGLRDVGLVSLGTRDVVSDHSSW